MIRRHRRMTMATIYACMLPRVKYIYSAYMLYIANKQQACIDFISIGFMVDAMRVSDNLSPALDGIFFLSLNLSQ